jgi:hypothetical protein
MSVSAPRLYELEARQRLGADSRSAALRDLLDERSRVEDDIYEGRKPDLNPFYPSQGRI